MTRKLTLSLSWLLALGCVDKTVAVEYDSEIPAPPMNSSGSLGGSGGETNTGGSSSGNDSGRTLAPLPEAGDFNCRASDGEVPLLQLTTMADGFNRPIEVAFAPGDDAPYVAEQGGRVWRIEDGAMGDSPFLDIQAFASRGRSTSGLLGLTFHPDYQDNGRFYVFYIAKDAHPTASLGETVVAEYRVSEENEHQADPDSERVLLIAPFEETEDAYHTGGSLDFDAEGNLLVSVGDGPALPTPTNPNGQDADSLLGKLIRIDPLGADPYSIPEGNLAEDEGLPEIFATGLRNPFRFTIDACTGDVFIGDVGLNTWEELDVLRPGETGLNFGWPNMEGTSCNIDNCSDFDSPVYVYETSPSGGAITGGTIYRGNSIPGMRGRYLYADSSTGQFASLLYDGETDEISDHRPHAELSSPVITAIRNGPAGEIYLVSLLDSALYKLNAL